MTLTYKATLELGAHTGTTDRVVYSLGGDYFLLAHVAGDTTFGNKFYLRGALYKVQGDALVEIEADRILLTVPTGWRIFGLYSAQVPFYGYAPLPGGGMVAALRLETSTGRRQFDAVLFVPSDSGLTVTVQTLYSETQNPATFQVSMNDWAGEPASWAGTFISMAAVAGGVVCVMSIVQTNSGAGHLYGVGARKLVVTAAGFGAASGWAKPVGWWDEDVDLFIDPTNAAPSGTGVVVYAETHDPNFTAQNARLLWIDENLSLGLNLEVPFVGEYTDSRIWPRQGGGHALIAYSDTDFLYHALTFTGTGSGIAFEAQTPLAIEGFQWPFTGPHRVLSGNIYINFESYGDPLATWVLPVTYGSPIDEAAPVEVQPMANYYSYWDSSEDGRSAVAWGGGQDGHELSLLQVGGEIAIALRDGRAAFYAKGHGS